MLTDMQEASARTLARTPVFELGIRIHSAGLLVLPAGL